MNNYKNNKQFGSATAAEDMKIYGRTKGLTSGYEVKRVSKTITWGCNIRGCETNTITVGCLWGNE